jgi:hypothetical protein
MLSSRLFHRKISTVREGISLHSVLRSRVVEMAHATRKNPLGSLARLCVKLQQFEFDIVHKKGKYNVVPDVLSRAHPEIGLVDVTVSENDNWYIKMLSQVALSRLSLENYEQWTIEDDKLYKAADNADLGHQSWKLVFQSRQKQLSSTNVTMILEQVISAYSKRIDASRKSTTGHEC